MKLEQQLLERSGQKCEVCQSDNAVEVYEVPPQTRATENNSVVLCGKCRAQIEKKEEPDGKHWAACLPEAMWSEIPGVKVIAWRMLQRFKQESWAADNLDMLYLEDDMLEWAKATGDHEEGASDFHRDSNGTILQTGDTVVTIKALDVKGTSFSAKLGTVVKNIRLVEDNKEQIEGKIEGQVIVILTKYVRKHS